MLGECPYRHAFSAQGYTVALPATGRSSGMLAESVSIDGGALLLGLVVFLAIVGVIVAVLVFAVVRLNRWRKDR